MEHASWLNFLPGYENLLHAAHALGWPFNTHGVTWKDHAPIGIQHALAMTLVVLVLFLLGVATRARVAKTDDAIVPDDKLNVRTFFELFVGGVYNMMAGMMGKKAAKFFLPLIGTCALVIFFSNALGLIPGFLPPTDNLNTTAAMAIIVFFATHIFGVKEHGMAYFKHFLGPIWWLAPLIAPIEIVSHLVRPVTLAVRLTANMMADHLVLTIFLGLIPWLVPLPVYMLGCIVVTVQTLVFCLLSTVYISMAIAHDGH